VRIHELKIKRFRNLRNFEITFTEDITMLLGKNGSAKSNLIEAIATIFSKIEIGERPSFAYYLHYECNSRQIEIDAGFSQDFSFRVKVGEEEIDYDSFVKEMAPAQFSVSFRRAVWIFFQNHVKTARRTLTIVRGFGISLLGADSNH
jgi:recombinational DNA repair ATPase RecF